METKIDRRQRVKSNNGVTVSPVKSLGGLVSYEQEGVGMVVSLAEHNQVMGDVMLKLARANSRADGHEENYKQMLERVLVLVEAGADMELLLTGSMKPSKRVRDGWENARKGVKAEWLAELKRDKARLDWLADVKNGDGQILLPRECVEANLTSMRGAIDQAMAGNFKRKE